MPDRSALVGTPVVIWGNTTLPNGTAFTVQFGDATPDVSSTVTDRSYVVVTHTYASVGDFTVKLTVGGETAQGVVKVCDAVAMTCAGGALTPDQLSGLKVNIAIEDGLRRLYTRQDNRTGNFGALTTSWGRDRPWGHTISFTALTVLAFENHGYQVEADPLGGKAIYQQVVQRGLNYLFDNLNVQPLTLQPAGDPCVGVPNDANRCNGLAQNIAANAGYSTSIAALAIAGSNAPTRTVAAGLGFGASSGGMTGAGNGGFVQGRSYLEIVQRQINAIAWGAADTGVAAGGYRYGLNDNNSDGSAIGWAVLAYLDAQAMGATVPSFTATELMNAITSTLSPDGGLQYVTNCCFAAGRANVAKTGVLLQALKFMGAPAADLRVQNAINYIDARWNEGGGGQDSFPCATTNTYNKGCAYGMFNAFKGLKLYGVSTLTNVSRPDQDWHKDYQDFLVTSQQSPSSPSGGQWTTPSVSWSCCDIDDRSISALAELILSPVALVFPKKIEFPDVPSDIILTNDIGTSHTVVAHVTTASGAPLQGATVTFAILAGPNAGITANVITDSNGDATFTYTSNGQAGIDEIQANIGTLKSPIIKKRWNRAPVCTAAAATPGAIWPPNHQLVPVSIVGVTDPDGDAVTIAPTAVFQDEPINVNGTGSGNTTPDAQLAPLAVRSERAGDPKTPGDGRVYHITFKATDPYGAACSATVLVCVPHDQGRGAACADGGALFNSIP